MLCSPPPFFWFVCRLLFCLNIVALSQGSRINKGIISENPFSTFYKRSERDHLESGQILAHHELQPASGRKVTRVPRSVQGAALVSPGCRDVVPKRQWAVAAAAVV